nr:hypothetical protein HmN_000697800 [Hymenolepis microstoma]
MSQYPNNLGFNQIPNQQPGFTAPQIATYPPMVSSGGHSNHSGHTSFSAQGGQTGFANPGQMGYPQQSTAPPAYGNASYYPTDGGGYLAPNPGMAQNHLAPNVFLPCTPPPNPYPNMPNHGAANPYFPPGSTGFNTNPGGLPNYPPQGGRPFDLLPIRLKNQLNTAILKKKELIKQLKIYRLVI